MRSTIAQTLPPSSEPFLGEEDRRKDASRPASMGRRGSRRQKVMLSAIAADLVGNAVISCRIENVSDRGARIKLAERRFVPSRFWLIAITAGLAFDAKVAWREDDRLGLEFGESVNLTDPASLTHRRLNRIWMLRR